MKQSSTIVAAGLLYEPTHPFSHKKGKNTNIAQIPEQRKKRDPSLRVLRAWNQPCQNKTGINHAKNKNKTKLK